MDQKKTGALIALRRKELGMTQRELADRLQVTDKAISKWETGKGFPDTGMLQPLAQVLELSVTEIVNGEISQPDEIVQKAEQAVLKAVEHGRRIKRFWQEWSWAVGIAAFVLFVAAGLIYNAIVGEPEPEPMSVGQMMYNSYRTVYERKNEDGSITTYYDTGDHLFWGNYPFRVMDEEGVEVEPRDDWKYRITYMYASNVDPIVFEFGDWYEDGLGHYFVQDGMAHNMSFRSQFMWQIEAVFDYFEAYEAYLESVKG